MKKLGEGQDLIVSVRELIEDYSFLVSKSHIKSFNKQGKLAGDTKKSIIKELKWRFEKVEYLPGAGRREATFNCSNFNGNTEKYNPYSGNGGSIKEDWSNEKCMFANTISSYDSDSWVSKSMIFRQSFGVSDIDKDYVSNFIKEHDFQAIKLSSNRLRDVSSIVKGLNNEFINQKRNLYKQIEAVIDGTNHDTRFMAYVSDNREFRIIDEDAYDNFKKIKAQIIEEARAEKLNHKLIKERIIKETGFEYVFEQYCFYDVKSNRNHDFDIKKIKEKLFDKMGKQIQKHMKKYKEGIGIVKGYRPSKEDDIWNWRLKKFDEYDKLIISFWSDYLSIDVSKEKLEKMYTNIPVIKHEGITQRVIDEMLEQEHKWENMTTEEWEQELKWQNEQDEQTRLDFEVYLDDLDYVNADEIVDRYIWELENLEKHIN